MCELSVAGLLPAPLVPERARCLARLQEELFPASCSEFVRHLSQILMLTLRLVPESVRQQVEVPRVAVQTMSAKIKC